MKVPFGSRAGDNFIGVDAGENTMSSLGQTGLPYLAHFQVGE